MERWESKAALPRRSPRWIGCTLWFPNAVSLCPSVYILGRSNCFMTKKTIIRSRSGAKWCQKKCRRFFNHFPAMFEYKCEHPDFLRDLLIWGDVHYNARGNELIARDLIAQYP